jgi:hypothetical protein
MRNGVGDGIDDKKHVHFTHNVYTHIHFFGPSISKKNSPVDLFSAEADDLGLH